MVRSTEPGRRPSRAMSPGDDVTGPEPKTARSSGMRRVRLSNTTRPRSPPSACRKPSSRIEPPSKSAWPSIEGRSSVPADPGGKRRLARGRDFGIEALEKPEARDSLSLDVERGVRQRSRLPPRKRLLSASESATRESSRLPRLKEHPRGSHGRDPVGRALRERATRPRPRPRPTSRDPRRPSALESPPGRSRSRSGWTALSGERPSQGAKSTPLHSSRPAREIVARKKHRGLELDLVRAPLQPDAQLDIASRASGPSHPPHLSRRPRISIALPAAVQSGNRLVVGSGELDSPERTPSSDAHGRGDALEIETFGSHDDLRGFSLPGRARGALRARRPRARGKEDRIESFRNRERALSRRSRRRCRSLGLRRSRNPPRLRGGPAAREA